MLLIAFVHGHPSKSSKGTEILCMFNEGWCFLISRNSNIRGGFKATATSKMESFVITVNYFHKVLHLGCCSSPRSASEYLSYYFGTFLSFLKYSKIVWIY